MAFAQLTYRESLRDIQVCLRVTQSRLYHLGIRGKISRNTLAHANQDRDWRIYADFAQIFIAKARKFYAAHSLGIELDQAVYALYSTTIAKIGQIRKFEVDRKLEPYLINAAIRVKAGTTMRIKNLLN